MSVEAPRIDPPEGEQQAVPHPRKALYRNTSSWPFGYRHNHVGPRKTFLVDPSASVDLESGGTVEVSVPANAVAASLLVPGQTRSLGVIEICPPVGKGGAADDIGKGILDCVTSEATGPRPVLQGNTASPKPGRSS